MLFVRRFHYEVEVAPHQAEAKHLNRGTRLRPSQQREKDSRPLKIPRQAHASLHDVMRTIWNDPAGFSPELRENNYLRHILNDWNDWNVLNEAQRLNGWNDWNWLLHRWGRHCLYLRVAFSQRKNPL